MDNKRGSLIITRSVGESFTVGDLLIRLVYHVRNEYMVMDIGDGRQCFDLDEAIDVGEAVTITMLRSRQGAEARIRIEAPRDVAILRTELKERAK